MRAASLAGFAWLDLMHGDMGHYRKFFSSVAVVTYFTFFTFRFKVFLPVGLDNTGSCSLRLAKPCRLIL